MLCIFPMCAGFYTVEPLQAIVIMFMGKVIHVNDSPGLSWYWPIGRYMRVVSLGKAAGWDDCQASTPSSSKARMSPTSSALR